MASSSFAIDIDKVADGRSEVRADEVAVEEPLEIRLGFSTPDGRATRSISITMRTPGHDAELAAGFLYTEGIVTDAADIASIEPCGPPAPDSGNHNVIRVDLAPNVEVDLARLQRHFYTTSINKRNRQGSGKFKIKKYDPVIRKHVEYVEKRIK